MTSEECTKLLRGIMEAQAELRMVLRYTTNKYQRGLVIKELERREWERKEAVDWLAGYITTEAMKRVPEMVAQKIIDDDDTTGN